MNFEYASNINILLHMGALVYTTSPHGRVLHGAARVMSIPAYVSLAAYTQSRLI